MHTPPCEFFQAIPPRRRALLFCTGTEMPIPCGTDMLFPGGEPNAMGQTAELNNAVEYIESHLGGEIDIAQAARLAVCSGFHFQRVSPVWPALR